MTVRFWIGLGLSASVLATSCSSNQLGANETEPPDADNPATTDAASADITQPSNDVSTSTQEAECEYEVSVVFVEGAPRDRFTISNNSVSGSELATVEIDLSDSTGKIIFDTIDGGSGVEVFQDFQVEEGGATLVSNPTDNDGGTLLSLAFASFAAGQSFTFSIDVDDQLTESDLGQIQVTDAEIEGASIAVTTNDGQMLSADFGAEANAVATFAC